MSAESALPASRLVAIIMPRRWLNTGKAARTSFARHQERRSARDGRPYRTRTGFRPDGGTALEPASGRVIGVIAVSCKVVLVSSSSFPSVSPTRSPVSVSSSSGDADRQVALLDAEPPPAPSLEDTFRTERDRLLHYLRRRVGHDAAPDLVQEVFARAASSEQAGHLINPAAFVRRIARNLLIDRARARKAGNVILFPLDEERDISVPPEQGLAIEAADLLRVYEQAVDSLSEKTRRVFRMSRNDNLTYRQISGELGITVATVEYHMMRAIAVVTSAVEAHR